MKPIIYEPHPVTAERKAQLVKEGYKIVDARFAPKAEKAKPKLPTREDIATMKRADVIEWLQAHGVDHPKGAIADLRDALTRIMYADL